MSGHDFKAFYRSAARGDVGRVEAQLLQLIESSTVRDCCHTLTTDLTSYQLHHLLLPYLQSNYYLLIIYMIRIIIQLQRLRNCS